MCPPNGDQRVLQLVADVYALGSLDDGQLRNNLYLEHWLRVPGNGFPAVNPYQ